MALHTRKQFAKLINKTPAFVNVYIQRQKIILSGDYIDDTIHQNNELLLRLADNSATPTSEPVKHVPSNYTHQPTPPTVVKMSEQKSNEIQSSFHLSNEKRLLEIDKLKKQNRILSAQAEKLEGMLIPTDLVKAVMIDHSESLKIAYNEASEKLIIVLSGKKGFSAKEIADIRKNLTGIINEAVSAGVLISKKKIKNIVREYSDVRGAGERKLAVSV